MNFLIGAYLIKAAASKPLVEHYLVALVLTNGVYRWYRIFEKTTGGPNCYETAQPDQSWVVERAVAYHDLPSVLARLQTTQSWMGYDPFLDNCEQYGRFIVEGKHYSKQARAIAVGIGCFVALALMKPKKE